MALDEGQIHRWRLPIAKDAAKQIVELFQFKTEGLPNDWFEMSPNGKRVFLTASKRGGTVFDVDSGKVLNKLEDGSRGNYMPIRSPNLRWMTLDCNDARNQWYELWDLENNQMVKLDHPREVGVTDVSNDGNLASWDGRVWDRNKAQWIGKAVEELSMKNRFSRKSPDR